MPPVRRSRLSLLKQEEGQLEWAAEHVVGVAKMEGVSEDIVADLRAKL